MTAGSYGTARAKTKVRFFPLQGGREGGALRTHEHDTASQSAKVGTRPRRQPKQEERASWAGHGPIIMATTQAALHSALDQDDQLGQHREQPFEVLGAPLELIASSTLAKSSLEEEARRSAARW